LNLVCNFNQIFDAIEARLRPEFPNVRFTPETAKKVAGRLNDYLDQSVPQTVESNLVN